MITNTMTIVNIGVLIALISSIIMLIKKKKYDGVLGVSILTVAYFTINYIIRRTII